MGREINHLSFLVILVAIIIIIVICLIIILLAKRFANRKRIKAQKKEKKAMPIAFLNTSTYPDDNPNIALEKEEFKRLEDKEGHFLFENEELEQIHEPLKKNEDELIESPKESDFQFKYIGYNIVDDFDNEESEFFPYVILPNPECIIKPPMEGRMGRKGFKEEEFKSYLIRFFSEYYVISDNQFILTKYELTAYEPDFTLINEKNGKNIFFDIEIDEPYEGTNDILTRSPTHFIGSDTIRNIYFQERGWIVIRFAEIQVHQYPLSCCLYIATVIHNIDPEFEIPNSLLQSTKLETINQWSKKDSEDWSLQKYRENYLGIKSFGYSQNNKIEKIVHIKEEDNIDKLIEHEVFKLKSKNKFKSDENNYNLLNKNLVFIPYRKGESWTLHNYLNKKHLKYSFDDVYFADKYIFKSYNCIVHEKDKFGLVKSKLDLPIKTWYDSIAVIDRKYDILFNISKDKKYNIINDDHQKIFEFGFDEISRVKEHLYSDREIIKDKFLRVKQNEKWGLIDLQNLILLLPCDYDEITTVKRNGFDSKIIGNKFFKIKKQDKYGLYDPHLSEISLPCLYDEIKMTSWVDNDNTIQLLKNNKRGLFDIKTKKIVAPCKYENVMNYSEGLYAIGDGRTWGFVDEKEREIIPCKYNTPGKFIDGISLVRKEGFHFLIDKKGKERMFKTKFNSMNRYEDICLGINYMDESEEIELHIFKQTTPTGKFKINLPSGMLSLGMISGKYIDIGGHYMKYRSTYRIGLFNLKGQKISEEEEILIDKENKLKKNKQIKNEDSLVNSNFTPVEKTPWKINGRLLTYKNKTIFKYKDNFEYLEIDGFYNGFGKLNVVFDVDAEFGDVKRLTIGYLDINGNIYWEGEVNKNKYFSYSS